MSPDANKAVVLATMDDGWNARDVSTFEMLLDAKLIDHSLPSDLPRTRDGVRTLAGRYWSAFLDLRFTIEDQLAEGDKVMTRWTARGTHTGVFMGLQPTGKPVVITGIRVDRIVGGKIGETWAEIDSLSLLCQLQPTT